MRIASFRRRRMRLRTTAPPTLRVIVKPKRGPGVSRPSLRSSSAARRRPSITNNGPAHRTPPRTRLNCDGRFRVSIFITRQPGIVHAVSTGTAYPRLDAAASLRRTVLALGVGPIRRTDASGPWPGAARARAYRPRSTYACGSRGGACERAGSADRSSSRLILRRKHGPAAPRARPQPSRYLFLPADASWAAMNPVPQN